MQELFDVLRIATGLRMARAAVGWSQVELAEKLGIAKTTLARAETVEGGLRAEQLSHILRLYRSLGVEVDFFSGEEVTLKMDRNGLNLALQRLQDDSLRRADRKKSGLSFTASIKTDQLTMAKGMDPELARQALIASMKGRESGKQ